jgi:paraquat-inducible protein B
MPQNRGADGRRKIAFGEDPWMTDTYEQASLPQAATRRSRRISAIWSIPLVAVAVAAWLVWDTLSKEGPTIEVSFAAAEGLEASKSQLKYKDIVFGTVTALRLSPDQSRVIVTIATTTQAKPLLTENAVFWVVKPRLFAGNISGLDTLLSGSYVGLLPSATPGKAQHSFKGQEDPPLLSAHEAGRTFLLKSKRIGSISVGSPIFFRDVDRSRSDAIPSQPTRQPLVPGLTGRHSGGTSQQVSHRQPAAASIEDPLRLKRPPCIS